MLSQKIDEGLAGVKGFAQRKVNEAQQVVEEAVNLVQESEKNFEDNKQYSANIGEAAAKLADDAKQMKDFVMNPEAGIMDRLFGSLGYLSSIGKAVVDIAGNMEDLAKSNPNLLTEGAHASNIFDSYQGTKGDTKKSVISKPKSEPKQEPSSPDDSVSSAVSGSASSTVRRVKTKNYGGISFSPVIPKSSKSKKSKQDLGTTVQETYDENPVVGEPQVETKQDSKPKATRRTYDTIDGKLEEFDFNNYKSPILNLQGTYTSLIKDYATRNIVGDARGDKYLGTIAKVLSGSYKGGSGKRIWKWEDRLTTLNDLVDNYIVSEGVSLKKIEELEMIVDKNKYLKRKKSKDGSKTYESVKKKLKKLKATYSEHKAS